MSGAALQNIDENRLLRKVFRGDARAFEALVTRHQGAVYNLCLRYAGPADAEDLAQETFIRAFLHREKFSEDRSVLPWLCTVARNLCIDKVRTARPTTPYDEAAHAASSTEPEPDTALSRRQEAAVLSELMLSLPEGQREALMLTDVEELSYQETADVLEVPVGTVMTWLHRGRARMKDLLVKREKRTEHRFNTQGAHR